MADQELGIRMKTTSDVPDAMGKAKTATVSFGKQVEDIQKKFSTAFKDIFLSFLGPMALLGVALNYISKLIEENQRKRQEANQAAIDGTNELMSAEDRYWARKTEREKNAKETKEQAEANRVEVTRQFAITQRERAFQVMTPEQQLSLQTGGNFNDIINDPGFQNRVQALIAEDMRKNPEAGAIIDKSKTDKAFKGPEGYGNVIGVGPNPVIEAMTKQVEVLEDIKRILEEQKPAGGVPQPFTEKPMSLRTTFNV